MVITRKTVEPKFRLEVIGMPPICYSDSEIGNLAKTFEFALIGKFSYEIPKIFQSLILLRELIFKLGFNVSFMIIRNVVIKLVYEEDFNLLWLLESPNVQGISFCCFKWSPTYSLEDESPVVLV